MTIEITKKGLYIFFEQGDRSVLEQFEVQKGEICSVRSEYKETPIINEETYPSKDKSSELTVPELQALLALKASDLGEDITVQDIIKYVSTALIRLNNENYEATEKEAEIHQTLTAKKLEISKTTIDTIRATALQAVEDARLLEEAEAKAAAAAEALAALKEGE